MVDLNLWKMVDLNPKLKYKSIKYHFNVYNIRKNIVELKHIESSVKLADILTKSC